MAATGSEGIRWRADRGKFQWRLRYRDALGVWHERSGFEASVAAAKRARRAAHSDVDLSGRMALRAWHAQYLPVLEQRLSSGTLRAYGVAWRRRVDPSLGGRLLRDITPYAVELSMASWSGSPSTKRDAVALLANLLRGAKNAGLVDQVATASVALPQAGMRDPTSRALTVAELDDLLELVPEGAYRRFVAGLAYTGCRLGEIAGLRVGDVDLAARVIHVRVQSSPGRGGRMEQRRPKSGKHREVPVVEALVPYLAAAMAGKDRVALVFPGPRGGRVSSTNLARALDWGRLRQQVRVFGAGEAELRFHDLRHSFATIAFESGVSATDVQAMLGHASLQVTQRYSTARADAAHRGAAKLNALLRGPTVAPPSSESAD